jgi:hypothetical protein
MGVKWVALPKDIQTVLLDAFEKTSFSYLSDDELVLSLSALGTMEFQWKNFNQRLQLELFDLLQNRFHNRLSANQLSNVISA